jgi:hypothetical protein
MTKKINWSEIAKPLDVFDFQVPRDQITRWNSFARIKGGVLFNCSMADGAAIDLRLDVVQPDVLRVRANPDGVRNEPSDMLIDDPLPIAEFELI